MVRIRSKVVFHVNNKIPSFNTVEKDGWAAFLSICLVSPLYSKGPVWNNDTIPSYYFPFRNCQVDSLILTTILR